MLLFCDLVSKVFWEFVENKMLIQSILKINFVIVIKRAFCIRNVPVWYVCKYEHLAWHT
jgi:hypothetical protein